MLTPSLIVPIDSCSMTISNNVEKIKVVKIYIDQQLIKTTLGIEKNHFTNKKWIDLKNIKLKNKTTLNILLESTNISNLEVQVVFHECTVLLPIGDLSSNFTFKEEQLNVINHDKCDFEIKSDHLVNCKWQEVVPKKSQHKHVFEHLSENEEAHRECAAKTGLQDKDNRENKYFIKLTSDLQSRRTFNTAYLASPIFSVDDLALITFSMHYAIHCEDANLNAYIGPDYDDIFRSLIDPFVEIKNESFTWQYMKISFDVSKLIGKYRVSCLKLKN